MAQQQHARRFLPEPREVASLPDMDWTRNYLYSLPPVKEGELVNISGMMGRQEREVILSIFASLASRQKSWAPVHLEVFVGWLEVKYPTNVVLQEEALAELSAMIQEGFVDFVKWMGEPRLIPHEEMARRFKRWVERMQKKPAVDLTEG